ncbi:AAA family ATPase [Yersinia enterocolitica]|nr:AAA family ATPase [Yersinia enterocolitica]
MEKKAHPKMGQKFPRQQPFIFQVVGVLAALTHPNHLLV